MSEHRQPAAVRIVVMYGTGLQYGERLAYYYQRYPVNTQAWMHEPFLIIETELNYGSGANFAECWI